MPQTKSQFKSFLGLTSYYRHFVPSYAAVAEPLTRLLQDNTPFQWTVAQQEAFDSLKQQLTSAPLLVHPDWSKPFLLQRMLLILLSPLSWLRSTTTTKNMPFLMLVVSCPLPNVDTIPARKSFWPFCTEVSVFGSIFSVFTSRWRQITLIFDG